MATRDPSVDQSPPLTCGSLIEKARFALDPVNYLISSGTRETVTRMQLPVYGVGTTEYVVVSDPELAHRVLTDSETFEQFSDIRHAMPFQNPLSNPQDDDLDWMTKRAAFVDAFTGASYRSVIAAAERQIADDVADLSTGECYDSSSLMRRLTMRMMAAILFDRTPPPGVETRIETAVGYGQNVTNLGVSSFLPVWTPRMSLIGFWLNRDPIMSWVRGAIDSAPDDALIWQIADSLGIEGDRLAGLAMFPLVAGFVSPEVMLSVCVDQIARAPQVKADLEEAAATLPRRPSYRDLTVCRETLRWPLFESLRLFPPTYFVTRRARERTTLDGYSIPDGQYVWIDQWSIGRHPDHWEAPAEFSPARWEDLSPKRTAFLPFGAGDRDCLGQNVSLLQGELVLSTLFSEFDVAIQSSDISTDDVRGGMSLQFDHPKLKLRR